MNPFDDSIQLRVNDIENAIENSDYDFVKNTLKDAHHKDLALLIQYLSSSTRQVFIKEFHEFITPIVISELNESVRDVIFQDIDPIQLADIFKGLENDDALEIFSSLDEVQQGIVLRSISKRNRMILQKTLSFPQKSAARLMQNEVPTVRNVWTVKQALNYVKYADDKFDYMGEIFVVDNDQTLVGTVSMYKLIKSSNESIISEIMEKNIISIDLSANQETVANLFKKYSLFCMPVVDFGNRLIGMITVDDIFEVVEEEIREDYVGIRGVIDSDFFAPVWTTSLSRMRWLVVTAVSSLLSSVVMSQFDYVISQNVYLPILINVVAGMGGAYGLQVNTVIIRAIAMQELVQANSLRTLVKECFVGLINGMCFAIVISFIVFLWIEDWAVSLILLIAILCNMCWAGIVGTLFPIVLNKLNLDPALSSSPLVGMTTDILGFIVFLSLAAIILL